MEQELTKWKDFESRFNACFLLRELNKLQKRIQLLKKEVVEKINYNETHKNEVPDCINCFVFEELENILYEFDLDNRCETEDDDCKNSS